MYRISSVGDNLPRRRGRGDCDNFLEIHLEGNKRLENIVFTISAGTSEDFECGNFTAEIGVGMDVIRALDTAAVTAFCRVSTDPNRRVWLPISDTHEDIADHTRARFSLHIQIQSFGWLCRPLLLCLCPVCIVRTSPRPPFPGSIIFVRYGAYRTEIRVYW